MIDVRDGSLMMTRSKSQMRSAARATSLNSPRKGRSRKALRFARVFSNPKTHPFDQIQWEKRTAEITDDGGKVIFKQDNVEVPKSWSQLATKVVVSKYFYGEQNTPERETSVRQLIHRVTRTIADWGVQGRLLQQGRRRSVLRGTDLAVRQPIRRVQFAGLVQCRPLSPVRRRQELRHAATGITTRKTGQAERAATQYEVSAGQRVLHPVRGRQHGKHHAPGLQRGDALQVSAPAPARTSPRSGPAKRSSAAAAGRADRLSFLKVYDQVANVVKSPAAKPGARRR